MAADPAAALAARVVAGSTLARTEALGAAARGRGRVPVRTPRSASCAVHVVDTQVAADGCAATVTARRRSPGSGGGPETAGRTSRAAAWTRSSRSRCGTAPGRSRRTPTWTSPRRHASRRRCLRAASAPLPGPSSERRSRPPTEGGDRPPIPARRYSAIIKYDRANAQAYADKVRAVLYPTYVRFAGADCANFASQCARRLACLHGDGLVGSAGGTTRRARSPSDDHVQPQLDQRDQADGLLERYAGPTGCLGRPASRGDFIFDDWSGDGVWDDAAVVDRHQQRRQKVVDAHTTDDRPSLPGSSAAGTKYRYAQARPQRVVV